MDWLHRPTEAVGEEELSVLQLLVRTIALAATATPVWAEALQVVVNRVVTTAQVAAIVAQWEGRRVLLNNTFRVWSYWGRHPTLVIQGHVPIAVTALHL